MGQRWFTLKPQMPHPFGLVVKCVLEGHPTAPVFDPHVPWAGRWGRIQLDQGLWRLLTGGRKQESPNASNSRTPWVSPWPSGPALALGGVGSLGGNTGQGVGPCPSSLPGSLAPWASACFELQVLGPLARHLSSPKTLPNAPSEELQQ